jgi:tRNA (cytidine/uridine-2'-O-)-methyltransferase
MKKDSLKVRELKKTRQKLLKSVYNLTTLCLQKFRPKDKKKYAEDMSSKLLGLVKSCVLRTCLSTDSEIETQKISHSKGTQKKERSQVFNQKGFKSDKAKSHCGNPQVVLISPQVPPNTGTIARLCAATSCKLHLIEPLGFLLNDKSLKRAGLDYWQYVDFEIHASWSEFKEKNQGRYIFIETGSRNSPFQFNYLKSDYLVFGAETHGIPKNILKEETKGTAQKNFLTLPMFHTEVRSLNLANTVSVVLYISLSKIYNL